MKKHHSGPQIAGKLREVGQGLTVAEVCRTVGRWLEQSGVGPLSIELGSPW